MEFKKILFDAIEKPLEKAASSQDKGEGRRRDLTGIFGGKTLQEITCATCHHTSRKEETFWDLGLYFSEADTNAENRASTTPLQTLIDRLKEAEPLCGSDQYFCDHCGGLQDAEKVPCTPTHFASIGLTVYLCSCSCSFSSGR